MQWKRQVLWILLVFTPSILANLNNYFGPCEDFIPNFKDYTCLEDYNIGQGNSGNVYLVQNSKKEKFVLKVQEISVRSEREINILQKFKDAPNIVTQYDFVKTKDKYISILEYAERKSLENMLATFDYFFQPQNAIELFKQLVAALHQLQKQGVVHCQINPKNIVIRQDYSPMLIDFDISLDIGEVDLARGVPSYMAPELIKALILKEKLAYDTAIDIYAVGVVLYRVLGNAHPIDNFGMDYSKMVNTPVSFKEGDSRIFMNAVMECIQLPNDRASLDKLDIFISDKTDFAQDQPIDSGYSYTLRDPIVMQVKVPHDNTKIMVLILLLSSILVFVLSMGFCYCQILVFMFWSSSDKNHSRQSSQINVQVPFVDSLNTSRRDNRIDSNRGEILESSGVQPHLTSNHELPA